MLIQVGGQRLVRRNPVFARPSRVRLLKRTISRIMLRNQGFYQVASLGKERVQAGAVVLKAQWPDSCTLKLMSDTSDSTPRASAFAG